MLTLQQQDVRLGAKATDKQDAIRQVAASLTEAGLVAAGYVDGANSLKDALNSYIQLYTEIDGATASEPFDWSTYDSRLQAIQDAYNAGIDKLKAADEAAAGKD